MNIRKGLAVLGATVAMTTTILGVASPASAATARNGVCEKGEFCLYFLTDQEGSVSDFSGSIANYGDDDNCYVFKGPGSGRDQCVKNNALSVWNRSKSRVRVFYNSNYEGDSQTFAPGDMGNLEGRLPNENASHRFLD